MKPLVLYAGIGAFLVGGYIAYAIWTGQVRARSFVHHRDTNPYQFWSSIAVYGIIAMGFLLVVFGESFPPKISN